MLSIRGNTYRVKSAVGSSTLWRPFDDAVLVEQPVSARGRVLFAVTSLHGPDAVVNPAVLIQRGHVGRRAPRAQPESVFFVDGDKKKKGLAPAVPADLILIHGRVNANTRRKYEREKKHTTRRKYARSRAPSAVLGEHLTKTAGKDGEITIGNVCIGRCGVRRSDGNGRIKNWTPQRRVWGSGYKDSVKIYYFKFKNNDNSSRSNTVLNKV